MAMYNRLIAALDSCARFRSALDNALGCEDIFFLNRKGKLFRGL